MEIVDVGRELIAQIFEIEKATFSLPWSMDALYSQTDTDRNIFLAATENGEVLGYVGLMFVLDEGYISNVAVSEKHRRRHVADMLITSLEERARSKGLAFMSLEVRASNASARALYQKHGYEDVGVRKNYYEKTCEDAVISTKRF